MGVNLSTSMEEVEPGEVLRVRKVRKMEFILSEGLVLPEGWRCRSTGKKGFGQYVMSPEGEEFKSPMMALAEMVRRGLPEEELENLRNSMAGWSYSELLPHGWRFKAKKRSGRFKFCKELEFLSYKGERVRGGAQAMKTIGNMDQETVKNFGKFLNGFSKRQRRKNEDGEVVMYSTWQLEVLEGLYRRSTKVTKERVVVVANHLDLTVERVSNWFKNREIKDAKKAKSLLKIEESYEIEVFYVNISDIRELDEKVKSMMTKSQNLILYGNGSHLKKAEICTVCGKEGNNIRAHIEAKHLAGVSIPCNLCGEVFKSRGTLAAHSRKHHM